MDGATQPDGLVSWPECQWHIWSLRKFHTYWPQLKLLEIGHTLLVCAWGVEVGSGVKVILLIHPLVN